MNTARIGVVVLLLALTACSTPMRNEADSGASEAWMCMDPLQREADLEDAHPSPRKPANALARLWVATQEMTVAALAQIARMAQLGNPTSLSDYPLTSAPATPDPRFSLPPTPDALELANMVVINNGGWQLNVGQELPNPRWPQCARWLTWSGLN